MFLVLHPSLPAFLLLSFSFCFPSCTTTRSPFSQLNSLLFLFLFFVICYLLLLNSTTVLYMMLMFRYCHELIPLHFGLLFIMLIAIGEALLMYNAWMQVNELGPALCYPSCTTPFLLAIVFSQAKSTLSRAFLLTVGMGLGVTRPSLPGKVWFGVLILHLTYFTFSLNVDIQDVSNVVSGQTTEEIWTMPAILSDLVIVLWIFLAVRFVNMFCLIMLSVHYRTNVQQQTSCKTLFSIYMCFNFEEVLCVHVEKRRFHCEILL